MRGQPPARKPAKPLLLLLPDRLGGLAEVARAAGLDLTEHQKAAARHDEVDLSLWAAPVAVHDAEAPAPIERRGGVLPLESETSTWVHARTVEMGCDAFGGRGGAAAGGLALEAGRLGNEVAFREL